MSRPVTLAETKTGDAALSIDPSGAGTKRAPAAEIIQEDLPAMAGPGSAGGSRSRDGRDFSPPSPSPSAGRASLAAGSCDGPSDWNGVAPREKEAEGDVLATPVPVPAHQGPPSFAQSEFHTVDIFFFRSVHSPVLACLFALLYVFLFFWYWCFLYCIDCSSSTS